MMGSILKGKQAVAVCVAAALVAGCLPARAQGNSQIGSYFGASEGTASVPWVKKPSALDGVLDLNPPGQSSSSRAQDLWDSQKNWVFKDLNDLFPAADSGIAPGLGMGNIGTGNQNSVEKYYDNQGRKNAAVSSSWKILPNEGGKVSPGANALSAWSLASPTRESSLFQPGDAGQSDRSGGPLITKSVPGLDLKRGQNRSLEEFKRMLDPRLPAFNGNSTGSSLDSLLDATRRPETSGNNPAKFGLPIATPPPKRSAMTPVLGVLDHPGMQPSLITGTTSKILGVEPLAKPAIEFSKPAMPKSLDPTANMPRRRF